MLVVLMLMLVLMLILMMMMEMLIITERQGYLLFCIIVLAASVLGFFWMGRVQQSLASGSPFKTNRKKKKLPKIRTPKPTDL